MDSLQLAAELVNVSPEEASETSSASLHTDVDVDFSFPGTCIGEHSSGEGFSKVCNGGLGFGQSGGMATSPAWRIMPTWTTISCPVFDKASGGSCASKNLFVRLDHPKLRNWVFSGRPVNAGALRLCGPRRYSDAFRLFSSCFYCHRGRTRVPCQRYKNYKLCLYV